MGVIEMRDEDEIQAIADKASSALNDPEFPATKEFLRGVRDALDWVLDEDSDDELF